MLKGLHALRGIAALAVVLYHASVWSDVYYARVFDGFFDFGYIGVDAFFVLSGFIIFYVHWHDTPGVAAWKQFFVKRLIRIYPPFLPVSCVLLLAYHFLPSFANGAREVGIVSSLFLVPTPARPALEVSWTLMHEMLFYLLFSLIYLGRSLFLWAVAAWGLLLVVTINRSDGMFLSRFFFNVHNIHFLLGMAVAFVAARSNRLHRTALLAGLAMLALYILSVYARLNQDLFVSHKLEHLLLGILFAAVIYGLVGLDREGTIRCPRPCMLLGSASYSIYLVHYPLVSLLNRIAAWYYDGSVAMAYLSFVLIVLSCLAAGILYYRFYEKRALRYLRQRLL
ncbi:MAG TPA: acyltransferase [Desulfobulbus sp.]|nr:acyltransferase [Desulfobulbus sp.]